MTNKMQAQLNADDLETLREAAGLMRLLYNEYREDLATKEWGGYANYMMKKTTPAYNAARKALYEAWLALDDSDPNKDAYKDQLWLWDDSDLG